MDSIDGTGDHENYFEKSRRTDVEGKHHTYKNCEKIAISVRTVNGHNRWPATTDFIILFSNLTEDGHEKYYNNPNLNTEEYADVDPKTYHKNINPEYGYVLY